MVIPGSMSNTPSRPCTTTALLCRNSLWWISTPSATCLSTRLLRIPSSLGPANERHSGGLLHPRGREALVQVVDGCGLEAPRGPAHPDRRHGRLRVELRSPDEHQLHVADEGTGREAPARGDAVVRHPPLHGTPELAYLLGREG